MEDPPSAHPLGLPWQQVTWLCLVTSVTGPDASGGFKMEGGSSREGEEEEEGGVICGFQVETGAQDQDKKPPSAHMEGSQLESKDSMLPHPTVIF